MKRWIKASSQAKTFNSYTIEEAVELGEIGEDEDWDSEDGLKAKNIYIPTNDECPYIGVQYEDGSYWIYGARVDHKCSYDEMCDYFNLT